MESKSISVRTDSKMKKSWSMTEQSGGFTKELRVREVENGFICCINKYGRDEKKKDSEYISEDKEYISKTNPLADNDPDEKEEEVEFSLKGIDSAISDMMGGITI
jgi:hypothetical protein